MATYNFSTISAAQALGFTPADTLQIDQGPANATTVLFNAGVGGAADTISLNVGASTITFSTALASATITYADGSRLFVGTNGNDTVTLGAGNDGLYGGAGADSLNGGAGTNQLQGNQGADILFGGPGRDVIYGGQDNDFIFVGGSPSGGIDNFAQGNKGDDTILGATTDNDILLGGQGNDVIGASSRGTATIQDGFTLYLAPVNFTGGGNDVINGNLGNDIIFSGQGDDSLRGEDGDDFISDFGGRNMIDAGAGNDILVVGGANTIDTGAGNDAVGFNNGTFVVVLGDGDDTCGSLQDISIGDHATVDGGAGNDMINGTDGSDSLLGGAGSDTIAGQSGMDTLAGGTGADGFGFSPENPATGAADQIIDWESIDAMAFFDNNDNAQPAGSATNYVESTAATYGAAIAFANTQIAAGTVNYVAVQVGADVFVFADNQNNNGVADVAVKLVGRSLTDIGPENILLVG